MSRRVTLPGAAELFRATGEEGGSAASAASAAHDVQPSRSEQEDPRAEVETVRGPRVRLATADDEPGDGGGDEGVRIRDHAEPDEGPDAAPVRPRRARSAARRPSGRERHEEKITVYGSAEELIDLEHARLTLRSEFGLAIDRGRIVREAVAVVIADLEAKGASSILVRRLRGRG